jgi:hypothetical protein
VIEPDPYDPARAKRLLQAVGVRSRLRTMERATFQSEWSARKLRGVCLCITKQQARGTDRKKREALLKQIQQNPAFLEIDPYPWSAPYDELKLKK